MFSVPRGPTLSLSSTALHSGSPPHKSPRLALADSGPRSAGSRTGALSLAAGDAPLSTWTGFGGADRDGGVKKFVVKNGFAQPTLTDSYTTASLDMLSRTLRALLEFPVSSPLPEPLETLYSACEALVVISHRGSDLYDRVVMELERSVSTIAKELRDKGREGEVENWLRAVELRWKGYIERVNTIRCIFLPLDRIYVLGQPEMSSIWDCALDLFSRKMEDDSTLGKRLSEGLASLLTSERDGISIDRDLFTSLVKMLLSLSVYDAFDATFVATSHAYYRAEADRCLEELETVQYLVHVEKRLEEEAERGAVLLAEGKRDAAVAIVEAEMLAAKVDAILEKGLKQFMEPGRIEDLRRLYALLSRVKELPKLRAAFSEYIKTFGQTIVMDPAKDEDMVPSLLEYKRRMDVAVKEAFGGDDDFLQAMKEAFEWFVNKRDNKPAEMIAKFLDEKLKSGQKGMSDNQLEEALTEALVLFRYTRGKDIFEAFYKRDFAKRLLLKRSASSDAERSMLIKLKEECGPNFTAKLEVMLKDIETSEDVMKSYRSLREKAASIDPADTDKFDLSVNVISQGNWPTYPPAEVTLATDMAQALDRFHRFYQSHHQGRKLTWQHSLGTTAVKAYFSKSGQTKELNVSLFQTVVLMLFNPLGEGEKLGYEQIREQTGLEDKELVRILQSLACGQVRVLTKHPKGRDVNPTDEFSVNDGFKHDRYRVRVNQIQMKETAEEQKSTTESVFLDRQIHLQLAIVRTLKARKTIKHQELVTETINQIKDRFQVDVPEIKKAVDILIDKEYMERDEDDRALYRYLA